MAQQKKDQKNAILENALSLALKTDSEKLFVFLDTDQDCRWVLKSGFSQLLRKSRKKTECEVVLIVPKRSEVKDSEIKKAKYNVIRSWSGNQSRFSRVKYAFLHGVQKDIINTESRIVCVLGPWGKSHLDTITVHDLALSWSDDFPFDPRPLMHKKSFNTVMAAVDIALDIGALGREGKPVGTIFVIGNSKSVMRSSRQAVFNPFKGYPKREKMITNSEVVESIKELAQLDGAIIISTAGVVEAAGRHLDAASPVTKQLRGLGSRHRAAAGITRKTEAVALVVSESTGRLTIFEGGHIVAALEPVISQRLV
jgi:hypothetical protein